MSSDSRLRLQILVAFAVVYLVWGSTYLAIRIGVRDIPPALLAGVRNVIAGVLIMGIACVRERTWPRNPMHWLHALVMGLLMVTLGNGLVTWAEVQVHSNQAALIASTSALWVAGLGTFGPKGHPLTWRVKIGLLIGLAGTALMLMPGEHFSFSHFGAELLILLSSLAWGVSVTYGRTFSVNVSPLLLSGMLLFCGGVLLTLIGVATGEPARWHWSLSGIGALVYLTVFGSCLCYSLYVWLIHHVTPDKLSTTAYVNPAIALILGWLVLDEKVEGLRLLGMLVILAGVILVTTRYHVSLNRRTKNSG